jgi:hypothetical protein
MVYYLGRDVKVYLTTESAEAQVDVTSNTVTTSDADEGISAALDYATATITFTSAPNADENITIISTDGTSRTYISATVGNASNSDLHFSMSGGTATSVATTLKTAIESTNGHNGKITLTRVAGVLTLTQATGGTGGNTTITEDLVNVTKTNFTGGDDDPDFVAGQTFAENLDSSVALTKIADLTGVDLGISVVDEDITYMGSKTVLKAEIKKETTISLTRKKSNNLWDVVYNGQTAASKGWSGSAAETGDYGARWGVIEGAADTWYINNGLIAPKDAVDYGGVVPCFGYRVHIELSSTETISIPACQLTGHTISLNADGTTEETCELISHVTPRIGTAANYVRLVAADM